MPRACSAQPELAWLRPGSGAAAWLDSTGLGLAWLGSMFLLVMGKRIVARTKHQVTNKNWVFCPWLAQLGSLLPCLVWPRSAKLASVRMSLALLGSGWPGVSWPCSAQVGAAQLVRVVVSNLSHLVQGARLQGWVHLFFFKVTQTRC